MKAFKVKTGNQDQADQILCRKFGITSRVTVNVVKLVQFKVESKTILKCWYCSFQSDDETTFKIHTKKHKRKRKHFCTVCKFSGATRASLEDHVRTHTGEKPFRCSYKHCSYRCSTKSGLRGHTKIHTGERKHKCSMCEYAGATSWSLKEHVRTHTGEKPFECSYDECSYRCNTKGGLRSHMSRHMGDRKHSCSQCDYKSIKNNELTKHINTVHKKILPEKKIQCPCCFKKFLSPSSLNSHMWRHTGEKQYFCQICKKGFANHYSKIRHELNCKLLNTGGPVDKYWKKEKTKFECEHCSYTTIDKSRFQSHLLVHNEIKPFKCDTCAFKCHTQSRLNIPSKMHEATRPFECPHCDFSTAYKLGLQKHIVRRHDTNCQLKNFKCQFCVKAFYSKAELQSHIACHTGERAHACQFCKSGYVTNSSKNDHEQYCRSNPHHVTKPRDFKCKLCKYAGTSNTKLTSHLRTHTGEKPYACALCEYKCSEKSSLVIHMRTHTLETPFKCKKCNYESSNTSNLKRHIRELH